MKGTALYRFGRIVCLPIFKLLFRMRFQNRNCLPPSGRVIICCNHISLKDPVFLALAQNRQVNFMAKAELFHNAFLAKLITSLGAFPVHRGEKDSKAISTAETLLQNDEVLGIFIEGTRSKDGNLLRPKSGAAMLAYQTGAPVLPMCISCKGGRLPKLFQRVTVSCGQLMSVEQLGLFHGTGAEFRNASRMIMDKIQEMRERDI